jgi:hypothetical protein
MFAASRRQAKSLLAATCAIANDFQSRHAPSGWKQQTKDVWMNSTWVNVKAFIP